MFRVPKVSLLWGILAAAAWRSSAAAPTFGRELRPIDLRKFLRMDIKRVSASTACPDIVSRSLWGARPPKARQDMATPVPFVILHHTFTYACFTLQDCSKLMRSIQNFHMDDRGWNDIGYSFLVGEDGRVYEGRGWDTVGAHAPWYNFRSIGISIMGNFTAKLPNKKAISAVQSLISCAIDKNKLNANYILYGHRQVTPFTACPGEALFKAMQSWPHWQAGDHFPPSKTEKEPDDVYFAEKDGKPYD